MFGMTEREPPEAEAAPPAPAQSLDAVEYTAKDLQLVRRAIRERWAVPERARQGIMNVAARIAADQNAEYRDRLMAIRCLLEADKVNLNYEKLFQGIPDRETGGKQTIIFNVIPTGAAERNKFECIETTIVNPPEAK